MEYHKSPINTRYLLCSFMIVRDLDEPGIETKTGTGRELEEKEPTQVVDLMARPTGVEPVTS
jgi:hypothetical protein